jgi:hypothetical protein
MIKPPPCASGTPSVQVCFSERCQHYPFICCSQECECSHDHEDCQFFGLESFLKRVTHREPIISGDEMEWTESLRSAYRLIIDMAKQELAEFDLWHNQSTMTQSQSHFFQMFKEGKVKNFTGSSIYQIYKHSQERHHQLKV